MENGQLQQCPLCGTAVKRLSRHHLIPVSVSGNEKQEGEIYEICRHCHNLIHHYYSNYALANFYCTPEKLKMARQECPNIIFRKKKRKSEQRKVKRVDFLISMNNEGFLRPMGDKEARKSLMINNGIPLYADG